MGFLHSTRKQYISGLFLLLLFSHISFKCYNINVSCRRTKNVDVNFIKYYSSGNFEKELQMIFEEPGFKEILIEIRKRGCRAINIVNNEDEICAGRIFDEKQVWELEKKTGEVFGIDTAVVFITPNFTTRYAPFEQREILAHELGHILKFFDVSNGEKDYLKFQSVESQIDNYIIDSYIGDEELLSSYAMNYLPQVVLRLEDVNLLRYQLRSGNEFNIQSAKNWADLKARTILNDIQDSNDKGLLKWQFVFGYYCSILPFELENYNAGQRKERFIMGFKPYLTSDEIDSLISGPIKELRQLLEKKTYPSGQEFVNLMKSLP